MKLTHTKNGCYTSYDELFEAFTELHNYLKKKGMKNASLKKKNVKLFK